VFAAGDEFSPSFRPFPVSEVMAHGTLKLLRNWRDAQARDIGAIVKKRNSTNHMRPADGGAFILPS